MSFLLCMVFFILSYTWWHKWVAPEVYFCPFLMSELGFTKRASYNYLLLRRILPMWFALSFDCVLQMYLASRSLCEFVNISGDKRCLNLQVWWIHLDHPGFKEPKWDFCDIVEPIKVQNKHTSVPLCKGEMCYSLGSWKENLLSFWPQWNAIDETAILMVTRLRYCTSGLFWCKQGKFPRLYIYPTR